MPRPRGISSELGIGFRRPPYRYALVPWTWATSGLSSFWRLPASAVGGVDLRPLPAQAMAGGSPQGFAFCAALQSPGGVTIASAMHMSETPATAGMQSAWQAEMGYTPQGATLADLLWDQLTAGSDPTGENGPKPLMPGTDGQLRLYVGGHSLVKAERFRFGVHPHTSRVRDLLRRDFERQWEATNGDDHCRRCLDFTCKKYRVNDWKEFVPQRLHAHVPGRLPHATTISDDMTRGDGDAIGNTLSWTEVAGDFDTQGNAVYKSGGGGVEEHARADSDLSGDDHYAQCVTTQAVASMGVGPGCRMTATSAVTFYALVTQFANNLYLKKVVTGTATYMVTTARTSVAGDVMRVEADGSTITGYVDTVSTLNTTDTAITGNVRCGLVAYDASGLGGVMNNFEAADLGGGVTENATPVTAAASVVAPTITLSQALAAVQALTAIVAPTVSLTQAPSPAAAAAGVVGPTLSLSAASSPVSAVAAIVSPATTLALAIDAIVSAAASIVSPATALAAAASPVTTAGTIPEPTVGRVETVDPVATSAGVVAPATYLQVLPASVQTIITLPLPVASVETANIGIIVRAAPPARIISTSSPPARIVRASPPRRIITDTQAG